MVDEGIQITIKVGQRDFPATLNGARIEESWETGRLHTPDKTVVTYLHGWTIPQIMASKTCKFCLALFV